MDSTLTANLLALATDMNNGRLPSIFQLLVCAPTCPPLKPGIKVGVHCG